MTKKAVIWGIVLIVAGLILGTVALFTMDFDFTKMNTKKLTTNTHIVEEEFQNIVLATTTCDIRLVMSEDDTCRVACLESEKLRFAVLVADDTLTITGKDTRKWYDHIGIHVSNPKVTVYLPKENYESLTINNTTGDVAVEKGFTFQNANVHETTGDIDWSGSNAVNLALETTTGDIKLSTATTDVLAVKTTTGDIALEGTTAVALSAKATTGDIRFDRFDARTMNIKTTSGDVTGTLLTAKQFETHSTTGDVTVPHDTKATDACKITVTTGDIRIAIS